MKNRHLGFNEDHQAYGVLLDNFDGKTFLPLSMLQKFSLQEDPSELSEDIINALCVSGFSEWDEDDNLIMTAEGDEAFMALWNEYKNLGTQNSPEIAENVQGWGISVTRNGITDYIPYSDYDAAEDAYHDWSRDVPEGNVHLMSRIKTYGAWKIER